MTIDLYYTIASPPCRSVILLAKALGVELNLKKTSIKNNETKTPEFLKINPQHCVPTLVDNGFSLWESRAILGYLANKYAEDDSLYPKDPQKRAIIDQRLYFDIGTLFPRLREYVMILRSGNAPSAEVIAKVEEAFQLLDKFLEKQDWVAGSNITIADYALSISASLIHILEYDIGKYTNITKWLARAKKAISGFVEVQEEGNAELKKMFQIK